MRQTLSPRTQIRHEVTSIHSERFGISSRKALAKAHNKRHSLLFTLSTLSTLTPQYGTQTAAHPVSQKPSHPHRKHILSFHHIPLWQLVHHITVYCRPCCYTHPQNNSCTIIFIKNGTAWIGATATGILVCHK